MAFCASIYPLKMVIFMLFAIAKSNFQRVRCGSMRFVEAIPENYKAASSTEWTARLIFTGLRCAHTDTQCYSMQLNKWTHTHTYIYIMKLVAGPQESLTAPKGWLVDLEPQGKWDVWPLAKMVVWPPGPKSPSAHRRHCFATNCDPLVVLSLDVMCIQVATCESLHWKWLEKARSSKIVLSTK